MEENKKTDLGSMTGIVIVVIVLLIGGFYFAQQRIEKSKEFQATISQSPSDEVSDIEKDASSMNFDDLGTGIDDL